MLRSVTFCGAATAMSLLLLAFGADAAAAEQKCPIFMTPEMARRHPEWAPPAGWTPPRPLNSHAVVRADYPDEAIAADEWGKAQIRYVVQTDGSVGQVTVVESSGYPRLDAASMTVVRRWRFEPATENGKPAACFSLTIVAWDLHGKLYPELPRRVEPSPSASAGEDKPVAKN